MNKRFIEGNLDNNTELEHLAAYHDDRIALIHQICDISRVPIRMKVYTSILCLKGTAVVNLNNQKYQVKPNDMLICHPDVMLQHCMVSNDFDFKGILMSPDYMKQLSVITAGSWDIKFFLEKRPVLQLTPEESKLFCQYYDLLMSKLKGSPRHHQRQLINALLLAFLYEFHDSLERFIAIKPRPFNASEKLFKEFMDLLMSAYPKPRSVNYYANRLCITPKYLTAVCKKITNHTASELINQYVVKDIAYLLHNPSISIKEVSNEMDFPNLSFFGKYVKKHLGCSPKHYREKIVEKISSSCILQPDLTINLNAV